jgi:ribosomal protein L14
MMKEGMVKFACNSGALTGKIIAIFRNKATIGSVIRVAVQTVVPNNAQGIKAGDLVFAVIIRSRQVVNYGEYSLRFADNAAAAIQGSGDMIGTNINGRSAPFLMDDPRAKKVEDFLRGKIISLESDFTLLPSQMQKMEAK